MNLSEPFIRRPIMTTLVMLSIAIIGIVSYFALPVSNLPEVDYPTITVSAVLPGASPETMANTVATPLEKQLMTISGLINISSSNTLGATSIVLQFDIKHDVNAAAQDVEAAISRALANLPPNLPSSPNYKKVNPAETPIIYIALVSDTMGLADLYTYANTFIGQRLTTIEGVSDVTTYGSPYAVRIRADAGLLASRGITYQDLATIVDSGNPNLPTGQFTGRVYSPNIVANGGLNNASAYQPLAINYNNGAIVRIEDIGEAVDGLDNDQFSLSYFSDRKKQRGVILAVSRQPGANTVRVADGIHRFLDQLTPQLPASIKLKVVFDKSESIRESIHHVEFTLIVALLLVVLVIFLYLGKVVDALIPSMALPLSILATFAVMYALNYSLDNLSLLALILATGFIVDDAIVVLENIVRHIEAGESPWEAALMGSKQISTTIVSMTLALIAAFIPVVFMGGLIGKILQEFAITLVVVVLASGVISLTLTPMLCSRFLLPRKLIKEKGFASIAFHINEKMINLYRRSLGWVLKHRKTTVYSALLSLLASAYFFYHIPKDFLPEDDMGFIIGFSQSAEGSSFHRMSGYQEQIEQVLKEDHNVEEFVSLAGMPSSNKGIFFARLIPYSERKRSVEVIQGLYPKLMMIPGVNTFLKNMPLIDLSTGTGGTGMYQYALQSLDSKVLYASAPQFIHKMQDSHLFQMINSDLEVQNPEIKVEILREQAAALGVSANAIEEALLVALSGGRVSRIQTPIDQYDVIVELPNKMDANASIFSSMYVKSTTTGQMIPLDAVVKYTDGVGFGSVNHIAQLPAVTISFSLIPGVPLGTALEELDKIAKEVLPSSITGSVQGAAATFAETLVSMGILLLTAILVIYVVLGILYESFIHPLTILSALPPAVFGAFVTLYAFGYPLSLYGYLGLLLLIGIVKKNGIMMIDYAIYYEREKKESPEQAIVEACLVRFRPIMMTTFAAFMGALPIALGIGQSASGLRPLGLAVIGGLLFSQLITLFLTPVIYLYLDRFTGKKVVSDE